MLITDAWNCVENVSFSVHECAYPTWYQYAGSACNPLQGLITVHFEAIDSVMCDPSIGVEWWDPAHKYGGGTDVLVGDIKHCAGH